MLRSKQALHQPTNPAKVMALGFFLIILAGTLLLLLPFSTEPGQEISPLHALFTATSAVCVTGLTVVDTASTFSLFGEIVIISLIQIGGLGFMMFATFVLVLAGKRISLKNRVLLHETLSLPGLSGAVRNSLNFLFIVLAVEGIGAIILAIKFIPVYGFWQGSYFGVFHAISAFCNAGFDLFGEAGSLSQFSADPHVMLSISLLIIMGGLGFAVIADLAHHRLHFHKLSLHSKIVLVMTGILLLLGMLFFVLVEWNNTGTLAAKGAGPGTKLLNAWFQSVTTRTAGYYSFQQDQLHDASKMLSTILMFVGASPASTGGGIKTTTFFIVLLFIISVFQRREDSNAFRRRLPTALAKTALSIFVLSIFLLVIGAMLLSLFEDAKGYDLLDLVFEEASALATVGLSAVGTGKLRSQSQFWLILLMYFGRIGPLTMMLSFARRPSTPPGNIRYPEENIIIS